MNHNVIITCALTGAGDTVGKNPHVPVTPTQIAAAAVEAAKAGATIVHCHVRDPKTGKGSRDTALYAQVMERIRESGVDIIVNLTAGMGGDLEIGPGENPTRFGPGTDLVGPLERLVHVEALLPDICTLDCGTLNFGDGDTIYVSTPAALRTGAKRITELGVKAELEIFDTGHLWFSKQMIAEGLLVDPLFQLCLGIPWGAPADTTTMKAMVDNLPAGRDLGRFWHRPLADADGGAGGAARRPCAGRSGGQPVAGQGRAGQQRQPGRARGQTDRMHGRQTDDAGPGSGGDGIEDARLSWHFAACAI